MGPASLFKEQTTALTALSEKQQGERIPEGSGHRVVPEDRERGPAEGNVAAWGKRAGLA